MNQAIDEESEPESGEHGVTIETGDQGEGNLQTAAEEEVDQSITSSTMAPKPALYETGKGRNDDRNLIAASDEAHYAQKELQEEVFDDASDADHSVVSYSDYSTTDGEESVASSSRKERRSHRRRSSSRRRKNRSRSKDGRSKRSEKIQREKEEDAEEESVCTEAQEEHDAKRSSSTSTALQGKQSVVIASKKTGDQPYIKLLNFSKLYREEQDRCPRFTEDLEKVAGDWNNCRAVLDRLLDEVKHANHLFHISDASFHQYSSVMYSIHKDIFLDDEGNRVLSTARQQLLLKQRGSVEGREEPRDSGVSSDYLGPLYKSFSVLTDTMMKTVLDRDADDCKQSATLEFQEFSEELSSQADAMKALGDSVLQEMEGSEQDIQNAFIVLEYLAAKAKTSKSSSVLDEDIKLGRPSKNFPKEMAYGGVTANSGDWWLWETLYRAAVKHQQITWEANLARMKGVEESLKYFQEKHQKKLEKAVLSVMPEQRDMFLVGAAAFEAALKKTDAFSGDLAGRAAMDHDKVASEFEAGVQQRSASLIQEKTKNRSTILNRSRSKYNSAIEQAESMSATPSGAGAKPLPAFGSPIQSKLVVRAKVLERWEKPGWMTTVAVFTVDRFLHLFDCSDLDTKTLPQTAFASMFPTTAASRANVHHQGGGRRKAKRATETKIPTPSMSFNLVTCTLKTYGYARRSFEIKQVADPNSNNKSKDLPFTTLRFKDNPEAAEWYAMLQNLPDYDNYQKPTSIQPTSHQVEVERGIEEIEKEAARQQNLYDDLYNEPENVDHDGVMPPVAEKEIEGSDDDFEDASEYEFEVTPAASARRVNGEQMNDKDFKDMEEMPVSDEIPVETVNDNDDDSFHST